MCKFIIVQISDVKFKTIGNQLIDAFSCDGFLNLGGDKYMTAMECGQLTRANKRCGHSFFHSEDGIPQGYCSCEKAYLESTCSCPREENSFVTEYKLYA